MGGGGGVGVCGGGRGGGGVVWGLLSNLTHAAQISLRIRNVGGSREGSLGVVGGRGGGAVESSADKF